jgi:RNA polymerase sigma-70 factor (ECF subfamily)
VDPLPTGAPAFLTTRWSLVAQAADRGDAGAPAALQELCRGYWPPLYAFLRRWGASPDDAQDLVQGFFARLLEKDWLAQADPSRGKLRTFLLAALKHHASNERARANAQKRGGGRVHVPLDVGEEERHLGTVASSDTPERVFERRYAEALLARAFERLAVQERAASPERAERFEALRPHLSGEGPAQAETAATIGVSATALKVALHRLRARLRETIRAEVAETLSDPAGVDEEIRSLVSALRRP